MPVKKWLYAHVLGSVDYQASLRLRKHLRENPALVRLRYSWSRKYLQEFLDHSILKFLCLYGLIAALFLVDEFLLKKIYPSIRELPSFCLFGKEDNFVATLVTALALIFPLALSLVTIILQRNVSTNLDADIRLYNQESLSAPIGASCMTLVIIFCLNLFFLNDGAKDLAAAIPLPDDIGAIIHGSHISVFLPIINMWWLIVNLIALWHFLQISLSFVYPSQRSLLRQKYAANISIPSALKAQFLFHYFYTARESYLALRDNDIRIVFGMGYDRSEKAVTRTLDRTYRLKDVWMRPLTYFLKRWLKRLPNRQGNTRGNSLFFPLNIGQFYSGEVTMCECHGDVQLTKLEKLAVYHCHRFERT